MKKIGIPLLGIGFAFSILVISLFRQSVGGDNHSLAEFPTEIEYSSSSAQIAVYRLPYPGILPDSPFYFIKMIRDRVRLILVGDDFPQANLLISYADKRIGASYYLASGNKIPLAYTTSLKAFSYLNQATTILESGVFSDEEKQQLRRRLSGALYLHMEVIGEILLMVEGDTRVTFERVSNSYKALETKIAGMPYGE